jgi:hypothetical protein
MRRRLLLVLLVALVGCGEDEPVAAPSPTPEASAVVTETPTPTPTATSTPSPTATEQPPPEEQEGGAGDEEEARVPARFVVTASGIEPPRVSIPAFLAIELIVVNRHSEEIIARLQGAEPLPVAAGETRSMRLDGRRPGRYPISFGPAGDGLLVTGADVGP